MPPVIEVSDRAYARLRELAGPLFTVSEVLERLIESAPDKATRSGHGESSILPRAPRERGISVLVGDHRIEAVSVKDLFQQFLEWLVLKGFAAKLEPFLPVRTSGRRYLIARKPVHPEGNEFVVPVRHHGYYMEAHKNYESAMSGLVQLGKLLGVPIRQAG